MTERKKTAKKTTAQFIEDAKNVHGDIYNYSKVVYKNTMTKITIICKIHGDFEQTPHQHLSRQGCRKCGIEYRASKIRSNIKDFIEKAIIKHGDIYDYRDVKYKNNKTKVKIICIFHGVFEQKPNQHLSGQGCPKCGIEYRASKRTSNIDEFIEKARKLHGELYIYSEVEYKNNHTKVKIICKFHDVFEQIPNSHLLGYGCPKCSSIKKYSAVQIKWLEFISKMYNIKIQHAENDIEYKIPNTNYRADGYCSETNTVYEFHGDYWHGNPSKFNSFDYNEITKCTFGELYQKTLERETQIKAAGFNLITIWENDWKKLNNSIKKLQRSAKNRLHKN